MTLVVSQIKYRGFVCQLGNLEVYRSSTGISEEWFTTLEEAYQNTLEYYNSRVSQFESYREIVEFLKDTHK